MEIKTTNQIISNHLKSEKYFDLDKKWVKVDDLIKWLNENSNPCMKCGSVQCAICSEDLLKKLSKMQSAPNCPKLNPEPSFV